MCNTVILGQDQESNLWTCRVSIHLQLMSLKNALHIVHREHSSPMSISLSVKKLAYARTFL